MCSGVEYSTPRTAKSTVSPLTPFYFVYLLKFRCLNLCENNLCDLVAGLELPDPSGVIKKNDSYASRSPGRRPHSQ